MNFGRVALLSFVPAAAALGCSLMTSLDDLRGTDAGADASPPVDAAKDGDAAEAGPPLCGAPGESCCDAPLAPCAEGLGCFNKKCRVNDAWALGEYHAVTSTALVTVIVAAHYDGATWTRSLDVLTDTGLTPYRLIDLHVTTSGTIRALVTKQNVGKMMNWNGVAWLECKLGNACLGPSGEDLQAMTAVTNGGVEFWLSAVNKMFRCQQSTCTQESTGIPGTWGSGAFAGTTSQDLWYSQFDHVLHFDGAKWGSTAVADAYTIGEFAVNDLWIGTKQLRHWDGKAWSTPYLADGAQLPGTTFSIAGSATNDGWAVGMDTTSAAPSFAAHWDGAAWTKKALPTGSAHVQRVYAPSPIDAFVVGDKTPPDAIGLIAHWDGTSWVETPGPKVTYTGETQPGALRWFFVAGRARPRR